MRSGVRFVPDHTQRHPFVSAVNSQEFIDHLKTLPFYHGQIVHQEHIPAHPARYGRLSRPLPKPLERALADIGASRLYTHQAEAINAVRDGHDVILTTSTASGKTLAYNVPILEATLENPKARALYLFPTKALAQDQLRALRQLTDALGGLTFGTYDGDTPREARSRLRQRAAVILTNPDMLHMGILPNHRLWSRFFADLRFVVLDEAHVYRGIFGSHVACVLRRLLRVCEFYGARPQFILCSATIANPGEHAERLTSRGVVVVDDDGSPRMSKEFLLWNPPFLDRAKTTRRSANAEAAFLFGEMVQHGIRNITFARTRKVAELILRYAREALEETQPDLASRVCAYRAGYLPEQRREIEQGLFRGRLLGVTATNALELGVDVGALDATVTVGYPGSIASVWQQAGRAGRGKKDSLSILIGLDNPLDQYFMREPKELFGRTPEHALIDPSNPYLLYQHLPCAAHERPLTNADERLFGPTFAEVMARLEESGVLEYRGERWFISGISYPAERVNIRSVSGSMFTLLDESNNYRMLEQVDGATALLRVHPGAVYLHQGETYLVTRLDLDAQTAYVRPVDVDYYTTPREINDVRIVRSWQVRHFPTCDAFYGQVRVTQQVIGYKRVQQYTETVLDNVPLELPPQSFVTSALWFSVPTEIMMRVVEAGLDFAGGLHALEHASIGLLPLFAMCDRLDIGGLSTPSHEDTGEAQVFIYDGHPGGVGIAEKGFQMLERLWAATRKAVADCPCEDGCPSCVQSPKCGNNNEPLDKAAAVAILDALMQRQREPPRKVAPANGGLR